MEAGHPEGDMWASIGHDVLQPLASGWLVLSVVVASLTLVISSITIWVRAVGRVPPGAHQLPVLSDVRTATGLSSGRGVTTMLVGALCLLIWILAWGYGSSRHGLRLTAASGVLSALVLVLLVSVAVDLPGFMNVQLVVGASASYQLAAGFYVALVGDLAILSLSVLALTRVTRTAKSGL